MVEMNKAPMAERMKRANSAHAAERGRHDGCGVSTDRSIRAPHASHANHTRLSDVPLSRSPQSRRSRKKASKSRSSRSLHRSTLIRRVHRSSPIVQPFCFTFSQRRVARPSYALASSLAT
jgi:hypothetical protein